MLIEADSIPYDAARLLGERLLVLAPHPDDEVIGCGGLVAQHLRERRAVRVVVATDGAEAGAADVREAESRRALELLGGGEIDFLRFPDRGLSDDAADAIRDHLAAFRPDLICVPSPVEIHPDHLVLSRVFCELVQRDATLFADLAVARVAFYEVSQPLRPNTLIDITDVADLKYRAIAVHESQTSIRDYVSYARGLNAYRALTLPPNVRFAEGYWTVEMPRLRTMAFSDVRRAAGAPAEIEVTRHTLPVTVVIRTKDRPALLREAIDSVRAGGDPAEIVVVNDGGAPVDVNATVVTHEKSRGRSEAMNSGVKAAKTKFIAFLDDDDLYYREHLPVLAAAAASAPESVAWYADSVSHFLRIGESGGYESRSRLRLFRRDFDRELLLVDNYIPLPSLLTTRDLFLDTGGFDAGFDLFEDWDFLIRLSERGAFTHVPRITCEVRHFEGGGSIILSAPEGSQKFREAKMQVWRKHAAKMTPDLFANVFERQKREAAELEQRFVDATGRGSQLAQDIGRLEREKNELIARLGELHNDVNQRTVYIKELEGAVQSLERDVEHALGEEARHSAEVERVNRELGEVRDSLENAQAIARTAYAEIERLQGLLNMIYKSRTWKLHTMMERMRGRG